MSTFNPKAPRMLRSRLILLVALDIFALAACGHRHAARGHADASPTTPSAARGAAVFAANCAVCHGDGGLGARLGGPLQGEHLRKSDAAIRAAIAHPEPPMPKLYPSRLSEQNLNDVTAYVESL